MGAYLLKRLLMAVPTLVLVAIVVFVLVRVAPGDPAQVLLGDAATPEAVAALRARLGLDQPFLVQFAVWARDLFRGDLGVSLMTGEPVGRLILARFGVSAPVVLAAVLIATLAAVTAGLAAAWRQNSALDLAIVVTATVLLSIPAFWLGLMLLLVFGVELGWAPVVGFVSFAEDPRAALGYIFLPVTALAIVEAGVLTRMMRASALDIMRLDYVLHARAKGLKDGDILERHVLPNAFAPTLTLVGLMVGNLLGGIAVIETVFTLPGLGRLMVDAVLMRDYPVIQGCLLFAAGIYICVNVLVDLVYPLLDPRVTAR